MGEFILGYITNFLSYSNFALAISFFENKTIQKSKRIFLVLIIALLSLLSFGISDVGNCVAILFFLIVLNAIFAVSNLALRTLQIIFSFLSVELLYNMGILFFIIVEQSLGLATSADLKNFFAALSVFLNVLLYKIILKKCNLGNLPADRFKYFFFYFVLLAADFIISHGFFEYILAQNETHSLVVINLAYVVISIGFYFELILVIYFMAMNDVHKKNEQMAKMYLNMQQNYYEYLEKREEDTRKFRHDIRNHLTMIRLLYNDKKYTEIEKYLDEFDVKMSQLSRSIDVGNEIVNALLNYYKNCMQKKSIHFVVDGRLPELIRISAYDLCTILSNLLDNSIEASSHQHDSTVKLSFSFDDIHYMITCVNPCKNIVRKNNTRDHGFGLKNVKETIYKHHGIIDISVENEIFFVTIILPRNEGVK